MSEAKPQGGSTVKGYRTLTAGDTEREVTAAEVVARGSQAERERAEALRCLAIARTKMQEACMWACRAVARPGADC